VGHLNALGLEGCCSVLKEGPLARGIKATDLPDENRKLLGEMFDDLVRVRGPR
jgi:hypothetical protein